MIGIVAPLLAACAPWGVPPAKVPDAVVLGRPYDPQNPFGKIVRHEDIVPIIYEDARVIAFLDYSPASPGHVLVISKTSRARNLLDVEDRDLTRLMDVARKIGRAEISGLGADGFTIEQNNGLPQSVPHLHVHVIPRYAGYSRCRGSGVRESNEQLEPFAARLRSALAADHGGAVPPKPADDLPAPPHVVTENTAIVPSKAVTADPAPDAAHPAAMAAVQVPSHGALLNAVLYLASGAGPHPTLLLLHGFPGNEQNLDLAQAARRDGWNVLTLHYRGSWGSPGAFSFAHCAEDAAAALAWLRVPDIAARYGIDPGRIVVAGHSMGGTLAARVAADDKAVAGAILIDPADMTGIARTFSDPAKKEAFMAGELRGDLPPLAGTSEAALTAELETLSPALDLLPAAATLADRPLLVIGAERAFGPSALAAARAARDAGGKQVTVDIMPTDHSFSDHRIALTARVIDWLDQLPR